MDVYTKNDDGTFNIRFLRADTFNKEDDCIYSLYGFVLKNVFNKYYFIVYRHGKIKEMRYVKYNKIGIVPHRFDQYLSTQDISAYESEREFRPCILPEEHMITDLYMRTKIGFKPPQDFLKALEQPLDNLIRPIGMITNIQSGVVTVKIGPITDKLVERHIVRMDMSWEWALQCLESTSGFACNNKYHSLQSVMDKCFNNKHQVLYELWKFFDLKEKNENEYSQCQDLF